MKAKYRISDSDTMFTAGALVEAGRTCQKWSDHVFEVLEDEKPAVMPAPNLKRGNVGALNAAIRNWERRIVAVVGRELFAGSHPVKLNLMVAEM